MAGALQYLESQRNAQPELAEWYNALADLYQRKLWHQLTLKLEQFVALAVVQVYPSSLPVCSGLGCFCSYVKSSLCLVFSIDFENVRVLFAFLSLSWAFWIGSM